jgi:hypothetical protein
MLDYPKKITEFIKANFTPSDPDRANFKRATDGLLGFLFTTFPDSCISDYELNDILLELGYQRHTWIKETTSFEDNPDAEITTIDKTLVTGWCMLSDFNLEPDIFHVPKERKGRGR